MALGLARGGRATLLLLHVLTPPSPFAPPGGKIPSSYLALIDAARREARRRLAALLGQARAAGARARGRLVAGGPAAEILKVGRGWRPDVIVIGTHGRGGVRRIQDAADRFLSTLAAADRVGLAIIPGPGRGVDFTENHAEVRQALRQITGLADRSASRVPVAEAKAFIERTDTFRWEQFVAAECRDDTSGRGELCPQELENEAAQVYQRYQERARMGLAGLRAVFEGLRGVEGPKTVVLVSEGLGGDMRQELQDLARTAAEAQVTLFVLLLDTPGMDISSQRPTQTTQENRDLETGSIYDLASLARGTVLRVSGGADQPFERIARELLGYYLVGFAPEPGDRDGSCS